MALNPSFRRPNLVPAGVAHEAVRSAIQSHDQSITDLNQAIVSLKSQITAVTSPTTSTASGTSTTTNTATENVTNVTVGGGPVNNQSGNVVYTTTQNDNGALIILANALPVALTLNSSVTLPWYCFVLNQGAGLVTITPQQGTINGVASETLTNGLFSCIFFDGTSWWAAAVPIVPATFAAITHQFLVSYDSTTGLFTSAQPAFTDVSGTAAITQGGTGGTTASTARANLGAAASGANGDITSLTGLTTPLAVGEGGTGTTTPAIVPGTNVTVSGTWPNQTVNASTTGLSVTITTAKLTTGGTNGSLTFANGLLTAQTPAT